jgi:hypothetical protein
MFIFFIFDSYDTSAIGSQIVTQFFFDLGLTKQFTSVPQRSPGSPILSRHTTTVFSETSVSKFHQILLDPNNNVGCFLLDEVVYINVNS